MKLRRFGDSPPTLKNQYKIVFAFVLPPLHSVVNRWCQNAYMFNGWLFFYIIPLFYSRMYIKTPIAYGEPPKSATHVQTTNTFRIDWLRRRNVVVCSNGPWPSFTVTRSIIDPARTAMSIQRPQPNELSSVYILLPSQPPPPLCVRLAATLTAMYTNYVHRQSRSSSRRRFMRRRRRQQRRWLSRMYKQT